MQPPGPKGFESLGSTSGALEQQEYAGVFGGRLSNQGHEHLISMLSLLDHWDGWFPGRGFCPGRSLFQEGTISSKK